jgi:hypothetical protein
LYGLEHLFRRTDLGLKLPRKISPTESRVPASNIDIHQGNKYLLDIYVAKLFEIKDHDPKSNRLIDRFANPFVFKDHLPGGGGTQEVGGRRQEAGTDT